MTEAPPTDEPWATVELDTVCPGSGSISVYGPVGQTPTIELYADLQEHSTFQEAGTSRDTVIVNYGARVITEWNTGGSERGPRGEVVIDKTWTCIETNSLREQLLDVFDELIETIKRKTGYSDDERDSAIEQLEGIESELTEMYDDLPPAEVVKDELTDSD